MNRVFKFVTAALIVCALGTPAAFAQKKGMPPEAARNAYKMLIEELDRNGDGELSMEECSSAFKDKAVGESKCRFWDANGDGLITEEEYVKQVMSIGRR